MNEHLAKRINEMAIYLWGPESSSLYHTKSKIEELANWYADEKVRKVLDRIEQAGKEGWKNECFGSDGSYVYTAMNEEIEAIRKELNA